MGYNNRMPSINASLGIGQLKKFNSILKIKKIIHNQYKYFIEKNYSDYFTVLSEPKIARVISGSMY